ncbi:lytic polysaccharide monooxygenase [Bipolaris maydis]|uniref:uncharacterized protein n=1 Tax=Cochliobolus heterostrophus TaxID=5016 RepID=UPI0024D2E71E|nr:lytic polysaccharide monooxygenase [Bipolaris maydis]KAJ5025386.1 hypothetical protein J3E73DRAFT_413432 [Bipolaris maydis]KAJ6269602.1 hypothetical protein PSV08DRAFT_392371 [Bipolaris maydis]KAJ6280585.1 hypothetical protein J3E71DRAFT_354286 [Bipolaris maydis]
MFFRSIFLSATALVGTTNAHVKMSKPVPYSADKVDTSPITKAQYPCKSQNGFTVTTMNPMKVGEEMPLVLDGTAVHGGGSCQLSVSMDTEPTANSVFKVIKSMEGGCPGIEGGTNNYTFTLPDSIPNGKATFAWTWMSKLAGQPELYMNCAPIEVTGGANDKSGFDALPDMLVINLDKSCEQVPNTAVKFPNPGTVVQLGNTDDLKAPVGECGSSGSTPAEPSSPAGGEPSSAPSSPAAGQPSVAPTSAAGSQPSASPLPPNGGGVFAPGASSGSPAGPTAPVLPSTSTTLVTVTATPTAPVGTGSPSTPTTPSTPGGTGSPATPTTPSTPGSGSGTPSTPGGGSSSCSENGAIVCNGATQFGICNNGMLVWQEVAAGTTCANGSITKRGYNGRVVRSHLMSRRVAHY